MKKIVISAIAGLALIAVPSAFASFNPGVKAQSGVYGQILGG